MSKRDPFADIRGKRFSEMSQEQQDRAHELWLRENYLSFGHYYGSGKDALFPSLFRVIDRLRDQVPHEAIGNLLRDSMDVAVKNGANSVSMPDYIVEVAAWLSGVKTENESRTRRVYECPETGAECATCAEQRTPCQAAQEGIDKAIGASNFWQYGRTLPAIAELPGWYAVLVSWDSEEGLFPQADFFERPAHWRSGRPVVAFAGPFPSEEIARTKANENDPDRQKKIKP